MAANSYTEAIREGGGNIHYVWHPLGQPYGVCSSRDLKNILDEASAGRVVAGVRDARQDIFGTTTIDGNILAEYPAVTPLFTGLEIPGVETWTLHETREMRSSGFTIVVEDSELGHTWSRMGSTKADGSVRRGLPGVHHIAYPLVDDTCGFAELRDDFKVGASSIDVYNANAGNTWVNAVEGESDYRLNWIGQECIALENNVTGTTPNLSCNVDARGIFKSREQHHYIDREFGASPLIYDVPPSLVGITCEVWGFLLDDDNSALLGEPFRERWGVISDSISTDGGKTRIKVNQCFQNLDEEFKVEGWNGGYLARYVFCRDDSGTTVSHVTDNYQAPHLTLLEWDSGQWNVRNIWLCDQASEVGFDTAQDVIDALMDELDKCTQTTETNYHQSQYSGNASSPDDNQYTTLSYKYRHNGRWIAEQMG